MRIRVRETGPVTVFASQIKRSTVREGSRNPEKNEVVRDGNLRPR